MILHRSRCDLPGIGALTVHTSTEGIAAIAFPGEASGESLRPWRAAGVRIVAEHTAFHARFGEELVAFVAGTCKRFRTPHDHRHLPPFLAEVLTALRSVPAGQTVSYGDLAAVVGRPRAARAVGLAMRRNPTPMLVPCHRVVASNGLGGFTPGLALKRRLLALEADYREASAKR